MALLLGIAGAVLGTQCPAEGAPLGICQEAGDDVVTGPTAAPLPPAAALAGATVSPSAVTNAPKPAVPATPAATPEATAAALSAHDLIEASHERLLLAQAKRPLFSGDLEADGDEGDGAGPAAAASPAQLSYAAAPAPTSAPEPPAVDRVAAPSIRAEFGTALPEAALPEETEEISVETAGVGGPLLPPLPEAEPEPEPEPEPEAEPLSLPPAGPDSGAAPDIDAAEAPEAVPVATAIRIGDNRVNVRSGPSTADARLFGLNPGEPVMAAETRAGWTKIEDAAGRTGWVLSELLAATDGAAATAIAATAAPAAAAPAEPTAAPAAATAPDAPAAAAPEGTDIRIVAGSGVSVREAPSNSGTRLFALAAGEEVSVTGSDKGWLQIVDGSGRTGWAYSDFLASKP